MNPCISQSLPAEGGGGTSQCLWVRQFLSAKAISEYGRSHLSALGTSRSWELVTDSDLDFPRVTKEGQPWFAQDWVPRMQDFQCWAVQH